MLTRMLRRAATALLISVFPMCQTAQTVQSGSDESETWANHHYQACLDEIFSRPETEASFRNAHELTITVRRVPNEGPKSQITIFMTSGRSAAARIIYVEVPVREQLAKLHRQRPGGPSELCSKVKVLRKESTSRESPWLWKMVQEIKRMKVPVAVEPKIILDANSYELWSTAAINEIVFHWHDAPSDPDGRLTRWVERIIADLIPTDGGDSGCK